MYVVTREGSRTDVEVGMVYVDVGLNVVSHVVVVSEDCGSGMCNKCRQ